MYQCKQTYVDVSLLDSLTEDQLISHTYMNIVDKHPPSGHCLMFTIVLPNIDGLIMNPEKAA